MRRSVAFTVILVLVIFAVKISLQAFRLRHSRVAQSVARQAAAERGEFSAPPLGLEEKVKELEGVDSRLAKNRYTVSFAARPCPADPNHVHNLGGDVRPGDIPYTGPYKILTRSGERYAEGTGPPDGNHVPMDDLPPGEYLLRITVPGTTVTRLLNIIQGSSCHLRLVVPHNCTMRGIR